MSGREAPFILNPKLYCDVTSIYYRFYDEQEHTHTKLTSLAIFQIK